jgi:hypothetical protein
MIRIILKKFLKVIGRVIGGIVILLLLYIVFNLPFGSKYRVLSESELQGYLDYLQSSVSDPYEFVSKKFTRYDVVLVGEIHATFQYTEFIQKLIPYLYRRNGVKIIGWEFGASSTQEEVDSLLTAPDFHRDKFIDISRKNVYWRNFQEYLNLFRVIWEFNAQLPPRAEPIRLLQLGSEFVPRRLYSPDPEIRRKEAERFYYDKKISRIIEREALEKNEKALVYTGFHHAFTRYRQPKMFFLKRTGEQRRGGNFLYDKYPDRVYFIAPHFPAAHRWYPLNRFLPFFAPDRNKTYYPFQGVIDQVYARHQRPLAFDARSSPFGELKDNYSYYSIDRLGGLKLEDFCDGYLMLCSFDEIDPVHPIEDWVNSEEELNEIKKILPPEQAGLIKDIPSFLKQLEQRCKRARTD